MTRPKVICNLCVTYELLMFFFHEKDTDRARLHTQSDRQKKMDVWTPYTLLAIGITIRKQI